MKINIKSDYVIANQDVKTGDTITFQNEGEWRTLPNDPEKEILTFKVEIPSGESKYMSVNSTSQKELMGSWGDETSKWIGKKAFVSVEKTRAFGKVVFPVYLSAGEKQTEDIPIIEEEEAGDVPF